METYVNGSKSATPSPKIPEGSRPIARVLRRLDGVSKTPSGWSARCPAHDDRRPSLSVSEGTDDRVLLKCHAGCSFKEVTSALGLEPKDLYPNSGSMSGRREIAATYPYTDERGEVLFEVVRYRPKGFRQRRPDGQGGWTWNLRGVRRVLYRLPAVCEAAQESRVVFVVEGEKDVHTLECWGFTATCNPQGAGSWQESYSEALEGARVAILPDSDEEGERHARKVARSTLPYAREVRIVELPGLPEKGDVTDWVEAGGSAEALKRLAQRAPRYEPDEAADAVHSTEAESEPPEDEEPSEDVLALGKAPPIPEDVYSCLPPLLQKASALFRQRHERDVFLTGAVPVLAGSLPKVKGYYGHNAERLAPNLYACIVAGAAGGKGPLRWAKRLASAVDEALREKSERERRRWEEENERAGENGEEPSREKPPRQSLILPANTSAAAFHSALAARGGRAVMVESEIDTLLNTLAQKWGQINDALRKAWHHEPISYMRKDEEDQIRNAALSLVMSGTPGQFRRLIQTTENGLYSRMAVYYFEAPPVWIDQRPTRAAREKEERFERMAEEVLSLFRMLSRREGPLWVRLREAHWDWHRETFAPMLRQAYACGVGHLEGVIKRAGAVAFRIAMTLAVWRRFEVGASLGGAKTITATDEDVEAGLGLACLYADHALRFGRTLPSGETEANPQLVRIGRLLPGLPEAFTNSDVYAEAEAMGLEVSNRQLRKDLQAAKRRGLIQPIKRSHWEKTDRP